MIKLIFLGSGSAFTVGTDNFQSNILIVNEENQKLLIDCGTDIRFSLHKAGFSHLDITDIYISHLHADHVGGLEYIAFTTFFDPRCQKPKLYTSKDIASDLWDRTLSGGLRFLTGDIADMNSFFDVEKLKHQGDFFWQGIKFQLVTVIHVDSSYYLMPAYGLFFEIEGVKIFITTDTQLALHTNHRFYEEADIIFHDCETSLYPSPVHASYKQLTKLPPAFKNKMWLYGYQPTVLPDPEQDGFLGFVKRGQIFEFSRQQSAVSSQQSAVSFQQSVVSSQ